MVQPSDRMLVITYFFCGLSLLLIGDKILSKQDIKAQRQKEPDKITETLRVRKLEVVDEAGNVVATLGVLDKDTLPFSNKGTVALALGTFDSEKKPLGTAGLVVSPDGSSGLLLMSNLKELEKNPSKIQGGTFMLRSEGKPSLNIMHNGKAQELVK